jgi:hypothetical protein
MLRQTVHDERFTNTNSGSFLDALVNSILHTGGSLLATLLCVVDCDLRTLLGPEISLRGTLRHARKGSDLQLSGTIPAKLSDFKIEPPSLLTLPVKNEMPVRVEMTWRRQSKQRIWTFGCGL